VINFATLFLGLVFGVQNVELVVADPVVAVDVILDGEVVETLKKPPWRVQLDLGPELKPHVLEVVALDDLFGELGRAVQRINVPRDPVEVKIAIEETETGSGAAANVTWESLIGGEPSSVEISLDGQPLEVVDPSRVELPDYDPELLHVLRAELEFGGAAFSTAELVFGGAWVGRSSLELTATVVEIVGGGKNREASDLGGSFLRGEEPLEVAVVEKEAIELVIIRSPSASESLAEMASGPSVVTVRGGSVPSRDLEARVHRRWRAQFLWPVTRRSGEEGSRFDLFPHSQHLTERDGVLSHLIGGVRPPAMGGTERLADAVAIAGLTAAASSRRRAVVVIVGPGASDASDASPSQVKRFLEHLRVPLHLWSVAPEEPAPEAWGEAADISSRTKLDKAVRKLLKELESQRVVWVKGIYLPNEISLSAKADGLRLAGAGGGER
jgi:hypothetical protein